MNKKSLIILFFIISNSMLSQENWTIYNTSNSDLTFDGISDIEFDSEGNKWIASYYNWGAAGIAKFDDSNWTIFNTNNSIGISDMHKIEFTTGVLESWVSVFATTTVNFSDGTEITINSDHDYLTNKLTIDIPINATDFQIDYYIEDSSSVDMVFFNTNTNELVHQETFSEQLDFSYNYTFFTNIQTNEIIDITIDNLDNKWLGTWQNGIIKYDGTDWINFTTSNSDLPHNNIQCITNDSNGVIWIGTYSGLTKFDGTNWTNYNTSNSNLPTNFIHSIAIDNDNNVWLSTGYGLIEFTGNNWNIFNDSDYSFNFVGGPNSLRIDSDNKKWMSALYGISSFDGINWEHFDYFGNNSCLLDCQTSSLAVDVNNDIWIGTVNECGNAGLLNFSECNSYQTSNSDLPDNNILSINIDENGIKWIGTLNGLAKLDNQSLSTNDNSFGNINIKFYPNPVNNYINVKIENKLIGSEYSIFDITGKTIKRGKLKNNQNVIKLKYINEGVYLLNIQKGNLTQTLKIIK